MAQQTQQFSAPADPPNSAAVPSRLHFPAPKESLRCCLHCCSATRLTTLPPVVLPAPEWTARVRLWVLAGGIFTPTLLCDRPLGSTTSDSNANDMPHVCCERSSRRAVVCVRDCACLVLFGHAEGLPEMGILAAQRSFCTDATTMQRRMKASDWRMQR